MFEFDDVIDQAKRIVGTSTRIADASFPNGAVLRCNHCGAEQQATNASVARYFSTGWPKHCGATMTVTLR